MPTHGSEPQVVTATYLHAVSEDESHAMPFLVYYPPEHILALCAEKIPLILFLHGQSSRGNDIMQVAATAFPELSFHKDIGRDVAIGPPNSNISTNVPRTFASAFVSDPPTASVTRLEHIQCETVCTDFQPSSCLPALKMKLPSIILCPQCPRGTEWTKRPLYEAVMALVDIMISQHNSTKPTKQQSFENSKPDTLSCGIDIHPNLSVRTSFCQRHSIDVSKVYVTGMSMGGLGSWMLAARYPDRFAAVVPICGGGQPLFAPILKDKPMWFFHSEDDNVIGVEETDRLVSALQRSGMVDIKAAPVARWCDIQDIKKATQSLHLPHGWKDTIAGRKHMTVPLCGSGFSCSLYDPRRWKCVNNTIVVQYCSNAFGC